MEQVLIAFDESSYHGQVASFEAAAELIQEVVEQYGTLNLPALTTQELYLLFLSPVDLVFDKMTAGQPLSIAGLEVHKEKAIELLKKPEGYEAFLVKVAEVSKKLLAENYPPSNIQLNARTLKTIFELNDNGTVVLKESLRESIERGNKKFANTDAAKSMFEFATSVMAKYKELEIDKLHPGKPMEDIIRIVFDDYSSGPALKISGITYYNSNPHFKRTNTK
jgi:hypothetical protein